MFQKSEVGTTLGMKQKNHLRGPTTISWFSDSLETLMQLKIKLYSWLRFHTAKDTMQEQQKKGMHRGRLEKSHTAFQVSRLFLLGSLQLQTSQTHERCFYPGNPAWVSESRVLKGSWLHQLSHDQNMQTPNQATHVIFVISSKVICVLQLGSS